MVDQKTSKSAKIFPLEKFRLYGIMENVRTNLSCTDKMPEHILVLMYHAIICDNLQSSC